MIKGVMARRVFLKNDIKEKSIILRETHKKRDYLTLTE